MKWMKLVGATLLGGALTFLPMSAGECYFTARYQPVAIAPVGQFFLPADLVVSPFPKTLFNIDTNDKLDPATLETAKKAFGPEAFKDMENYDVETYQLALDDGETYHVGWLMALRDKRPLNKEASEMMKKLLTPAEKANMEQAQVGIKMELFALNDKMVRTQEAADEKKPRAWFKVLGLSPFEYPVLANTQGYGAGLRLLLRSEAMHMPLFIKGYAMGPENHLAILAFVTLDSERDFWAPIWERAAGTYKPLAVKK